MATVQIALARLSALAVHEAAHALCALAFGGSVTLKLDLAACRPCCHVQGVNDKFRITVVRHAGWVASVALALYATVRLVMDGEHWSFTVCAVWTALDGITSDLLGVVPQHTSSSASVFWCGNFGLLVLDSMLVNQTRVSSLLHTMLRITTMRGAQSAGLATFRLDASGRFVGQRARVVNGKRTDLPSLLLWRARAFFREPWPWAHAAAQPQPPTLYQGHTRFATSSISSLDGAHPHQWTPAAKGRVWWYDDASASYVSKMANVEAFITHNGDLDFFSINGQTYALGELRTLLARLLHRAAPSDVDSACIAGLLELLRTRGHWLSSARRGYAYGGLCQAGNAAQLPQGALWSRATLVRVASLFEREWCGLVAELGAGGGEAAALALPPSNGNLFGPTGSRARRLTEALLARLEPVMIAELLPQAAALQLPGDAATAVRALVRETLLAFCNGDLLHASRALLQGARGSFGLVFSHSLDAHSDFLVAARGQTMSISFYPQQRLVLFGSEASACKAGLNPPNAHDVDLDASRSGEAFDPRTLDLKGATRFDLDDVNGEVVLVRWEAATEDWHLTKRESQLSRESSSNPPSPESASPWVRRRGRRKTRDVAEAVQEAVSASAAQLRDRFLGRSSSSSIGDRGSAAALVAPAEGMQAVASQRAWLSEAEASVRAEESMEAAEDVVNGTPLTAHAVPPMHTIEMGERGGDGAAAAGGGGSTRWLHLASDDPAYNFHEVFRYGGGEDGGGGEGGGEGGGVNRLLVLNFIEGGQTKQPPFFKRLLRLDGNPLIQPLPDPAADPVGADIADIPSVLRRQMKDWDDPVHSFNRMSAWAFASRLQARLGKTDGSVDLLITGCEISLWLGEQLASDLHLIFPKLKIVTLSANKLLGQLGQQFPVPQAGFAFNSESHSFRKSVVLLLSHSGGTFATLACANMLKAFTPDLFAVTSEWDTQVARVVREGLPGERRNQSISFMSYVFVTFAGPRLAEPCSVSAVAMHQLLTQLLLHTMMYLKQSQHGALAPLATFQFGATYQREEVHELAELNASNVRALDQICSRASPLNARLRAQGHVWAQHVLEAPLSWLLSLLYIGATILSGYTPLSAALGAAVGSGDGAEDGAEPPVWAAKLVGVADTLVYAFLPWWTTVLLRLLQRRPWLHRVAGRTLVVCDLPYVAQTLEAFVSKLFALTYSITALNVDQHVENGRLGGATARDHGLLR